MNLIIKLPPKAERDELVDAWVNGLLFDQSYTEFHNVMQVITGSGFHHNGVTCLFLHETTTHLVHQRISKLRDSEWIDAAFKVPICLN
ncbi:MAG: hypothetical protein RL177_1546 [Bacteroidota bacterium]|jgi:hypothetical protein